MNNHNTYSDKAQDQRFVRKVNHLQGVVGMGNWTLSGPTAHEMIAYQRKGRSLQSKAIRHTLGSAASFINIGVMDYLITPFITYYKHYTHRQQARNSARVLLKMDDHILEDIGISRVQAYNLASDKLTVEDIDLNRGKQYKSGVKDHSAHQISPANASTRALSKRSRLASNDARYTKKCA